MLGINFNNKILLASKYFNLKNIALLGPKCKLFGGEIIRGWPAKIMIINHGLRRLNSKPHSQCSLFNFSGIIVLNGPVVTIKNQIS